MKENANPIIYAVERSSPEEQQNLVGTPSIQRLNFHSGKIGLDNERLFSFFSYKTPEERSAYIALRSCSVSVASMENPIIQRTTSRFDPLGLLRQAGFDVDAVPCPLIQRPQFNPHCSSTVDEEPQGSKEIDHSVIDPIRNRDLFTADEVFEMIRNIQDPEHPLTLEQLHVVNRNHIQVIESVDMRQAPFSFVHVHFT
jgi:hypothetical protein